MAWHDPALINHHKIKQQNPFVNQTRIYLGKVMAVHPERGTIDVALDYATTPAGYYAEVPVMSWSYGSKTGQTYMPTITLTEAVAIPNTTYEPPFEHPNTNNVWAVIAHLDASAQNPICLGFLSRLTSQAHTSQVGMQLMVHESGVYTIITQTGNVELHLPDGSVIMAAPTGASATDMTQYNPNWEPATTTTPYAITINTTGAITINGGTVTITGSPSITLNSGTVALGSSSGKPVAREGDTVSVTVNGTVYTGTITSGSSVVSAS